MRTDVGKPGHSTYTEFRRACEQQSLLRRDRLRRRLPRSALQSLPVAIVIAAILSVGAHAPVGIPVIGFLVALLGWPLLVLLRAYDPVPDIEVLRETAEAERNTARTVSRLRRGGYFVLHDRVILGSEETIDHLLIGPGGIFVLTSDPTKGIVRYAKDGVTADGVTLRPVIERTAWFGTEVRAQLRQALPMVKVHVTPILVMTEADVLWSDGAIDNVTIITLKDINSYIRHRPNRVNPTDVSRLLTVAERIFPPYSSNRIATDVSVDRDHWLALMDALRTIRERDGDATGMLERLAQIESDLARQGDPTGRTGFPFVRGNDPLEVAFEADDAGDRRSGKRRAGSALLTAVRDDDETG
jgi:hypothetical protein